MLKNLCFLFLLLPLSVLAQSEPDQFVVTRENDTIEARRLFYTENELVLKTPYGEKLNFGIDEIALIKQQVRRQDSIYVEVLKTPRRFIGGQPMVILEKGTLDLWLEPNFQFGSTYLIREGDDEYYVDGLNNFERLEMRLRTCPQMEEHFPEDRDYLFRNVRTLVSTYNEHCD